MNVARMLQQWQRLVQQALGHLHRHQVKALATLSLGIALAQSCQLARAAIRVAIGVHVDSTRRRFERLIGNRRLSVRRSMRALATAVLASWAGRRVDLLLDETPLSNHLRCMKISVRYRGRAVPLMWVCYRPGRPPLGYASMVRALMGAVDACLPDRAQPVLLADRGLAWPNVIALAHRLGWRVLMRVQDQTRVRLPDGEERAIGDLTPRAGTRWYGRAKVFKAAGWITLNIAAHRPAQGEPWLLVTDLPPHAQRFEQYRRRMQQEQAFKDEKTGGFRWNDSRVRRPTHAHRLLLALAIAMWLALSLGTRVVKRGLRRVVGRATKQRQYSYFRLGLHYLTHLLHHPNPPPLTLRLCPNDPKIKSVG